MTLGTSHDFYGLHATCCSFMFSKILKKSCGCVPAVSNSLYPIPNNGLRSLFTIDLDFQTDLIISCDIQTVSLISSPIYIPEFQRYPKPSHKLKNAIQKRARLLRIYCLNFSLPLCSRSSLPMLMNSEGV